MTYLEVYTESWLLVNGCRNSCTQNKFGIIVLIGSIALNLPGMQITDNSVLIRELSCGLLQLNVPTGMFSTSFGIGKVPEVCKLKFCRVLSNMHNEALDGN